MSTTDPEITELLEMCYPSTGVFAKTFMPEAFRSNMSSLHKQMLAAIDGPHKKIAIAAPRGLGKTSTVRAYVMKSILYRDYEFVSYVSNGETVAMLQTENIKAELRSNQQIRKIFGDIAINTDDEGGISSFSKHGWTAFGNTYVIPRGAGQQVRGLLYKSYRPQLIVVDDLEDKETIGNLENRNKLKEWFHSDLEKSVDRYSKKWRIIYIDTLKHGDALLQELLDDPEWHGIRLDLCDDDYNSNVPELFTNDELKIELESHREKGLLHVFYMEYRNLPTSPEIMSFKDSYFKYFDEASLATRKLETVIIMDPAKTAEHHSADTAIVAVSFDLKNGEIFVRDIVRGKMLPDVMYDELFAMRERFNVRSVGIEVTGLNEFIKQPIINEISRRPPGDAFEPVWLHARGGSAEGEKGKTLRIKSLLPYYRRGFIYHNKANCGPLESQLLQFPRGKLLDVADATAYVLEMMSIGDRYFDYPGETPEEIEEEYDDIDYEPALDYSENWLRI